MKATRTTRVPVAQGPFWRPDARERLRALLPELMLSVVATTCSLIVMDFLDTTNLFPAVILLAICQVVVQGALYALTYLSEKPEMTNVIMLLAISTLPMFAAMATPFVPAEFSSESFRLGLATSAMMGMVVFYLTRLRVTFYLLLLEVLVISDAIRVEPAMMLPHLIGLSAYIALYIVRRSPAHMSLTFEAQERFVTDGDTASKRLSLAWQTTLLAATTGAFCLSLTLGTGWCLSWWQSRASTTAANTQTIDVERQDESEAVKVMPEDDQPEDTAVENRNENREKDGEQTGPTDTRRQSPLGLLFALASALAVLGLPFMVRLLMRRRTRASISRERRASDRAARIYLETLSRLKALGIERSEDETPREFLILYEDELVKTTDRAGLDPNCWQAITDVYEKARYAELDATEPEIEACWQVYDALPKYARRSLGWFRYLTGSFWHM